MSMKFFAGLQDFLGLYDTSSSNSEQQQQEEQLASSASTTATIPAAAVVKAASSSLLSPPLVSSVNSDIIESEKNSLRHISGVSKNCIAVQDEQQQLHHSKITLDDSEEVTDAEEKIRQCSHKRSVHFPDVIVTDFYDAPTNIFTNKNTSDTNAISISYLNICKRLRVDPIQAVQEQIACFHQVMGVRQECLSLKGHRLSSTDMECLEEIFNKVQFDMLDFEYTFLDDDSAVCLGEMLEFYDSAVKLNLSFNKQINLRGWQAICKAVRDAPSMQYLNLRYTSLSDRAVPVLARALRSQSSLTVLHLENVSLSGRNLILVGCALKGNTILRELYLGENNLQPADGAHIYQIIITSVSIQLLDLRNNHLQDGGLRHICDALRHRDTAKNSALSALVLWNNRLTSCGMEALAQALMENGKLETLNIGNNSLLLDGIVKLKPALQQNCSLQRLGLQATNLDCQSAIVLAECLADNKVMIRLDLRDNPHIGSAGLLALHLAMKMNTSLTVLNLDTSVAQSSSLKVKEYQEQFKVYYEEIKMFCERNKEIALKKLSVFTTVQDGTIDTDVKQNEKNTEVKQDEEKDVEEQKQEIKMTKNEHLDNLEVAERKLNIMSNNAVWLLGRSSSLTCTETIDDISERVAQMTHSLALIEQIPDSITTTMKQPDESYPALFTKNELSKCPSLPSITGDHPETGMNQPVKKISRRFTVSTSSLNATNPRDVVRAKSRFKVEQVGSSIQKTAKAKSDDCIPSQRSLDESFVVDTHGPDFLTAEGATLEVENLTVERVKESENSGFVDNGELPGSFRSRGEERMKRVISQDVQEKDESCGTKNVMNSYEEEIVQQRVDEKSLPSSSLQFNAVITLQQKSDMISTQDYFGDATFVVKFTDNVALKLDVEKCSACEQPVSMKHPMEQSPQEARDGNSATRKFDTAFSSCSAVKDDSADTRVVKEVVRDLINYVVYEISDDDSIHYQKLSESSPAIRPLLSVSRSPSSSTLNPSHNAETDENVIHNIVRGLVRDILLQEKELLRRSLRKKRRHLVTMSKMDCSSSS